MLKKIVLWQKVLIGLLLGIFIGIVFPSFSFYIDPIGKIFLRLIMMVAPFMIFTSLVSGIISISYEKLISVAKQTIFAFFSMSIFAVLFGIFLGNVLHPGQGVTIKQDLTQVISSEVSFDFKDFLINIIPDNIIAAFVNNNFMQIVFLAMFVGIILNKTHNKDKVKHTFNLFLNFIIKVISSIMILAPYATCALISHSVATLGFDMLISLSKLVFAILIAMVLQYFIFGILIKIFAKISPIPFYKKSIEYQAIAFSTSSSKVALPITIEVCEKKMGTSETAAQFILPLGASINMSGLAIYLSLCTIFFAQIYNIDLNMQDYIIISITSIFGSIGGAGVPGSSLIMLPLVMSSVNLPLDSIVYVAGIDRFLDMIRTTVNITGDCAITIILDARMKTLNLKKYYSEIVS